MVFLYLAQPSTCLHLVAYFYNWFKVPKAFAVKCVSILTALQENAVHLVEVVLQTIIVMAEHAWTKLDFEHMACEFCFGTNFQSACALKDLHIYVLFYDLDDLCHQTVATCGDVAYLALDHRSIHLECDHIGNYATNNSFCHIYLVFLLIIVLTEQGIRLELLPLHEGYR